MAVVGPIDWEPAIEIEILNFFRKGGYPYRALSFDSFDEPYRSAYGKFAAALDAYYESENPAMPIDEVIRICARKDGATTLKRIRTKSFSESFRARFFDDPEWWDDIPSYQISDIGQIFNYSYAIHFSQDDPQDYKYGEIEVDIDPDTLYKFRMTARKLLSEIEVEEIDYRSFEFYESSSVSINRDLKKKPNWLMETREKFGLSDSIGLTKRSIVEVSPENTRDTVIVDPKSRNRIRLIEKQLSPILRELDESFMEFSGDEIRFHLKRIFKDFEWILCRDFTKEGITKPRELLRVMLEELNYRFPDFEAFKKTNFYSDFRIEISPGEIFEPKRGHGLGMANGLTSFMQCIISEMIRETDDSEGLVVSSFTTCCYNDDHIAFFKSREDLEIYWDIEGKILRGLGLLRKDSKSFRSEYSGVLCEEFFSDLHKEISKKDSYKRKEVLNALFCENIVHAKDIVSSLDSENEHIDTYLEEIVSFWGYEFFREEHKYPAIMGGWINPKIFGVDMSLRYVKGKEDIRLQKAFNACREKGRYLGRLGKNSYNPPIFSEFPGIEIPEEYSEYFNDVSLRRAFLKMYQRRTDPTLTSKIWEDLRKRRREVYCRTISISTYEDFIKDILEEYKNKVFYPVECMISHTVEGIGVVSEKRIRDPYFGSSGRDDLVSYLGQVTPYGIANNFTYHDVRDDILQQKFIEEKFNESLKTRMMFNTCCIEDPLIIASDDPEFIRSYICPMRIGLVTNILEYSFSVPVLKEEFRPECIKSKESMFNRFLTIEELLAIRAKRDVVKKLVELCDEHEISVKEAISLINLERKKEKAIEIEESDSEEEEELPKESFADKKFPFTVDGYYEWRAAVTRFTPIWQYNVFNYVFEETEIKAMIAGVSLMNEDRTPVYQRQISMDEALGEVFLQRIRSHIEHVQEQVLENQAGSLFGEEEEDGDY